MGYQINMADIAIAMLLSGLLIKLIFFRTADPIKDGLAWLAGPLEEQAMEAVDESAVDESAEDASF